MTPQKSLFERITDRLKGDHLIYYLLFLAAALRVQNFNLASIWNDESITLDIIHQNVTRIFSISTNDVNAPFYTLLTHFWAKLFGYSLPAVRFFSVVCSTLTVAVIFKMSDKYFGRLAAIISSLWFCFSNIHIYYSEEARCYALLGLLVALGLYYFLGLLRTASTKNMVWYSLFSLLAIYTQFFSAFQLLVQGLILLIVLRADRGALIKFIVSQLIVVVIFLCWFLPTFVIGRNVVNVSKSWVAPISLYNVRLYLSDLTNTESLFYILFFVYIIALGVTIILQRRRGESTRITFLLALVALLPFIMMCAISYLSISIFYPRYVMFTSIALMVSLGGVIAFLPYRKLIGSAIIGVMLYMMIPETRVDAFRSEDWDKACALEVGFVKDSTCFIVSPYYAEFCYIYYNMRWAYDEQFDAIHSYYKGVKNLQNLDDSITFKHRQMEKFKRVIYYDAEPEMDERLPKYFKMHYDSVYQRNLLALHFTFSTNERTNSEQFPLPLLPRHRCYSSF